MDSPAKYGPGVTTPRWMVRRCALLARGAAVPPASHPAMLETLAPNEDGRMRQRFAPGVRAAHTPGVTEAHVTMGRMDEAIVQAWGPPPIRR